MHSGDKSEDALGAREMEPFRLEKSGLSIENGSLVKRQGANLVARHELADIEKVEIRKSLDPFAIVLMLLTLGGAAASVVLIEKAWISWTSAIVFGLVSFFSLVASNRELLRVSTSHGEVLYHLVDPSDHSAGFAVSLKELIGKKGGFRL